MSSERLSKPKHHKKDAHIDTSERQAHEDVAKILPILEKDPDWPYVSGQKKLETQEDWQKHRRSLTRLTKKAVKSLYPELKNSVQYDSGTASDWVIVNFILPETPQNYKEIRKRTEKMLESVGIQYSTYLPDSFPGEDKPTPCLLVEVNHTL